MKLSQTPSQQRQARLLSSMDTTSAARPSATLSCLQDLPGAGALVWASLGPEGQTEGYLVALLSTMGGANGATRKP